MSCREELVPGQNAVAEQLVLRVQDLRIIRDNTHTSHSQKKKLFEFPYISNFVSVLPLSVSDDVHLEHGGHPLEEFPSLRTQLRVVD